MWVNTQEAARSFGVTSRAIRLSIERSLSSAQTPPYKYRYTSGKGRGGKSLEIWVDKKEPPKESKAAPPKPPTTPKSPSAQDLKTVPFEFLRLSKKEQKRVKDTAQLVQSYLDRARGQTYHEWAQDNSISYTRQHFTRLVRRYRKAKHNVLDAMSARRGRPRGIGVMSADMKAMAERYILRSDIHPNDAGIYANMREAFGDALPSFSTVQRYLERYRAENRLICAYAANPDKARGTFRPAVGSASAKAKHKNHFWELDGTPADVFTSDGKRQTIIAAIDIFSRRVVVSVEEKTNSYAITRNLREGLLKLGVPENIICDNGSDYTSAHFESACLNLGINKQHVEPYSGWQKPHIERFFGTMTRELFQQLEGFCGHDVSERAAIVATQRFEEKLEAVKHWRAQRHSSESFTRAMTKEKLPIFVPLSADELRAWIKAWVESVYERRVHGSLGISPLEKYTADITPANVIKNERSLDILLGEWDEYTIGKKGIVMRRDGYEAQYAHPSLFEHIGEKVFVVLGTDMGVAYIYDAQMQYLCTAKDVALEGLDREAIRSMRSKINKLERTALKARKEAERLAIELRDPTIKDVISSSGGVIVPSFRAVTQAHIDIEVPREEKVAMNGDRPLFNSDFDALVWAIENNKTDEYQELIEAHPELYNMAMNEVEYRRGAAV